MFDGKTFFPVTGMPMRKMACISKLLALAEPVPFTVPILNAKSLTRDSTELPLSTSDILYRLRRDRRRKMRHHRRHARRRASRRVRHQELELSHVPRGGRTPLGAEPTVQTDILVLHHD